MATQQFKDTVSELEMHVDENICHSLKCTQE